MPGTKRRVWLEFRNAILIALGVLSACMGLEGFLLPSGLIDGGVTGVCMLLAKVSGLSLAVWLPVVNLPFLVAGYRQVGRAFALRSAAGIGGLAGALAVFRWPDVTPDPLLSAVFGGFFLGAGIGLAVRGSGVLDGTEIAALLVSKRSTLFKVGDVILAFNVVLFLVAMSLLGVERALYSILTYLAAARTVDFLLHGIDEYTAMTVVSEQSHAIRERIIGELGRGVTVYRGRGGKSSAELEILYCVVTRLEIGKLRAIVLDHDPAAFLVYHPLAGAEGGMMRPRGLH
jgi:uncharacterized membrane-anchored protein YitT (DUF2179 family)